MTTETAITQFRREYVRHLKEQSQTSSARVGHRTDRLKALETVRLTYKQAIAEGGFNPTGQENVTETEAEIATLKQAAEAECNVLQIPPDLGARYRTYVEYLAGRFRALTWWAGPPRNCTASMIASPSAGMRR